MDSRQVDRREKLSCFYIEDSPISSKAITNWFCVLNFRGIMLVDGFPVNETTPEIVH